MSESDPYDPFSDPFAEEPVKFTVESPPGVPSAMYRAQLDVVRMLLAAGGLNEAGLAAVRTQLRTGLWNGLNTPPDCRSERAECLDAISQWLTHSNPDMAPYYGKDTFAGQAEAAATALSAPPED